MPVGFKLQKKNDVVLPGNGGREPPGDLRGAAGGNGAAVGK